MLVWLPIVLLLGMYGPTQATRAAALQRQSSLSPDVCTSIYMPGRCSRAVVSTLGHLVVSKLFFAAFFSPVLALAIQTQLARNIKRGCKNLLTCKSWSAPREATIDLSVMIASVTMLLEYCLVLGFAVPVILPLTCLTFVLHLAVFHRATQHGFQLKMDAKPSSLYLQGSLLLGCVLIMWFFLENDLHGQMLVVVGMPAMFLAAVALDKAVPLSEAPWAWLDHGPSRSLSFFTDPNKQNESVEIVELASTSVATLPLSVPTMGSASEDAALGAASATRAADQVVRI